VSLRIEPYERAAPACRPYDPEAPAVARAVIAAIAATGAPLCVHHVGSSAVAGLAGKGNIDLLVTYREGGLEEARRALERAGFQRQQSRDPFPEERPMRVGSVVHAGRRYLVHAHVIGEGDPEAAGMLRFRDRLRADPGLCSAYEAEKRRVLAAGVVDGVDYAEKKGAFVERVLAEPAPEATP